MKSKHGWLVKIEARENLNFYSIKMAVVQECATQAWNLFETLGVAIGVRGAVVLKTQYNFYVIRPVDTSVFKIALWWDVLIID